MNPEHPLAVVIFEDETRQLERLQAALPDIFTVLALTTIEACKNFVTDPEYANQLLQGAILVACIVDGRIAPQAMGVHDGLGLLEVMNQDSRFSSVLLISNSGSGPLAGAHAHLEKAQWRLDKYLPELLEVIEQWKKQGKGALTLE